MRKYQKRYERLNTPIEGRKDPTQLTPKTKVKRVLRGRQVDVEVKKGWYSAKLFKRNFPNTIKALKLTVKKNH